MTVSIAPQGAKDDNLPLGLRDTIIFGFDAAAWQFLFEKIFDLTYSDGNDVILVQGSNSVRSDVPDGMNVRQEPIEDGSEATTFHGKDTGSENKFSVAVSASLGADGVSVSTSDSIATISKVEKSTTQSTTLVSWYKLIYVFNRTEIGSLDPKFTAALAELPATFDLTHQEPFRAFFKKWGTHYLAHGHFGGNFIMNTQIDESVLDTLDSTVVEASIKANFDAGVAKGSAGVDITKSTQDTLKIKDSQITANYYSTGGTGGTDVKTWLAGVSEEPTLLYDAVSVGTDAIRPTFTPIHMLVSDAARQAALLAALKAYLPPARVGGDSVFDKPIAENASARSNTRATSNRFAILCVAEAVNQNIDVSGQSGQGTGATLGRAASMTTIPAPGIRGIERASVILPVKQDTYYDKSAAPTAVYISTGLQFGEYQKISSWQHTAESDGFLILTWEPGRDAAGRIEIAIDSITLALSANARPGSNTDQAVSSLCVPVAKGATVSQNDLMEDGNLAPYAEGVDKSWLPLNDPNWKFGQTQQMSPNERYPAATDGFAFATLQAGDSGSQGNLEIRTLNSQGADEQLLSACGVQFIPEGNQFISCSTCMLPISSGKTWSAVVTTRYGGVNADVYWMPLMPTS